MTCIVVSSGYGDGSYPCYWGLDAQGKPVSLVVDFLVIAEFLTDRCKLPWPPANGDSSLTHPILADHEVSLTLGKADYRLAFHSKGRDFSRAIWHSATGTVVADTQNMDVGVSTENATNIYYTSPESLKEAAELEVELHAGYRN